MEAQRVEDSHIPRDGGDVPRAARLGEILEKIEPVFFFLIIIIFYWTIVASSVWRRQWHPTPVFLSGESQGRGSLVGCRLWGCTESDATKAT